MILLENAFTGRRLASCMLYLNNKFTSGDPNTTVFIVFEYLGPLMKHDKQVV